LEEIDMASTGERQTKEASASVQKGAKVLAPQTRTRPTSAAAEQEADTEQVWPHLVVIEFLASVIFTINLVLLGTLVNGPLDQLANPDCTPNPSKAPWYFLNLQELLLHMNPALAGVIVPTVALGLIAVIPYVDRGSKGLGVWFYSARGPRIIIFTTIYTTVVCFALIALDKFFPLKDAFTSWLATADVSRQHQAGPLSFITQFVGNIIGGPPEKAHAEALGTLIEIIVGWTIPTIFFLVFPVILVILLKILFRGINLTEIIMSLCTGFVVVYAVLTFVGTAMRGPGMDLFPPWGVPETIRC
jgi:menaquinol-cytochrome c reductase cytochrome b/c subunit